MAPSTPGASPGRDSAPRSFYDEVCEIREDLEVWRLAVRRAGSFDLAEDALQDTFYAVARVADPDRIENLRGYFCRTLIRQIAQLRGRLVPLPVEDPEAEFGRSAHHAVFGSAPNVPVDDGAIWHLHAVEWMERLRLRRQQILAAVPQRSTMPGRYRSAIVAATEEVLRAGCDGLVSPADFDAALRETYPEWFAESDCTQDTRHQRLSRGRRDVREALQAIVSRDELSS